MATLTFELRQAIGKVNPSIKFWVQPSNGLTVRVLNDTQMDGTNVITYTANAGGNKVALQQIPCNDRIVSSTKHLKSGAGARKQGAKFLDFRDNQKHCQKANFYMDF